MENKRSFEIIKINSSYKTINKKIGGRFISYRPYDAGLKAFNYIIRDISNDFINFKITIKESTRKSNKKEYKYNFTRYKLLRPIVKEINKKSIKFQYKTTSKKITKKQYQLYLIKQKSKRVKCSKPEKNHLYLKTCCNKSNAKNYRTFESCKKHIKRNRNK